MGSRLYMWKDNFVGRIYKSMRRKVRQRIMMVGKRKWIDFI